MKTIAVALAYTVLAFSVYAEDSKTKPADPSWEDCPLAQEHKHTLDQMHTLLDQLYADCTKGKEPCATKPQLVELRKLHAELKAVHDRPMYKQMPNHEHTQKNMRN